MHSDQIRPNLQSLHPYYLYPFRLYIDGQVKFLVDEHIKRNSLRFDRITVFHDFDSALLGFHSTEKDLEWLLTNLHYTKDYVIHAIEYTCTKLVQQYLTLREYGLPVSVILFSSVGQPKWHKSLWKPYKEQRRIAKGEMLLSKVNLVLRDIQDYVAKSFTTDIKVTIESASDFARALKTIIKDYVAFFVNNYLPDHAFVIEPNVDADIIPYVVLRQKYRPESLYLILSSDKDLLQILGLADPDHNNILQVRKVWRKQSDLQQPQGDTEVISTSDNKRERNTQTYLTVIDRKTAYWTFLAKRDEVQHSGVRIHVNPYAITLHLALTGDLSDNIPNCRSGIGIKTLMDIITLAHIVQSALYNATDYITFLTQLHNCLVRLRNPSLLTKEELQRIKQTGLSKYVGSRKIELVVNLLRTLFSHVAKTAVPQNTKDAIKHHGGLLSIDEVLMAVEAHSAYKFLKDLKIDNAQANICFVRNLFLVSFELYYRTQGVNQVQNILAKIATKLKTDYRQQKLDFDTIMQYRTGMRTNLEQVLDQIRSSNSSTSLNTT